jgi:hypothetical protein
MFSIFYEYVHADGESKLKVKASWVGIHSELICTEESLDLSRINFSLTLPGQFS